jgi:hypothetical protein
LLAAIEHDEQRPVGQERVAAQWLPVEHLWRERTDGQLLLERRLHVLEHGDLQRICLLLSRAIDPPLDDAKIGQNAFGQKRLEIGGGIRRAVERGVVEIAQHEAQHVLLANAIERFPRQSLALGAVLAGDVAEDDLGVRGLFRLEDVTEPVDALVGHLDGAEVHLAAEPGGHGEAGQCVEDRRLSGASKTNEPDFDGAPRALRIENEYRGKGGRSQTTRSGAPHREPHANDADIREQWESPPLEVADDHHREPSEGELSNFRVQ